MVVSTAAEVRMWCWDEVCDIGVQEPSRHYTSLVPGGGRMRALLIKGKDHLLGLSDAAVRVEPSRDRDTPLNTTLHNLETERRRAVRAVMNDGASESSGDSEISLQGRHEEEAGIIDLRGGKIGGGSDPIRTLLGGGLGQGETGLFGGLFVSGQTPEPRPADSQLFKRQVGGGYCHLTTTCLPQVSIPRLVAGYDGGLFIGEESKGLLWDFTSREGFGFEESNSPVLYTDKPRRLRLPPGTKPKGLLTVHSKVGPICRI